MEPILLNDSLEIAQSPASPAAAAFPTRVSPTMTQSAVNDPQAVLTHLYDEHATTMFRWVIGMLGRREDAEDAVHSVWLKLAQKPARLSAIEDLPAYAWTAIRHHVHSVLRRRALERLWSPPLEDDDSFVLPLDSQGETPADELRDLARAVRRLRPKLRAVVLLVGFAGYTLEEAAHRLGIPRGTAASRHHAAIQKLKTLLDNGT